MKKNLLIFLAVVVLQGCSMIDWMRPEPIVKHEMVEVKVPVYIKQAPPAILTMPLKSVFPRFIDPRSSGASSALDIQGEQELKLLLIELTDRQRAWKAWSK
jgi:hypothetical protein